MSSPLAVGAVSAVLRNLLDNGMVDVSTGLGSVRVTAVAPDTIDLDDPNNGPSLNIFMYRVSRNIGWENAAMPSHGSNGSRLSNQPLALNLHYLITAYGTADFEAEILLGYAMHLLHEHPVLDRDSIRVALNAAPLDTSILPPAFQAVSASDLADQIETVSITQEPIDTEEMSKLWSAIQTHFRPSAAYVASVVLIEARKPVERALPVLSRGPRIPGTERDTGPVVVPGLHPPFPTITDISVHAETHAALLGDTIEIAGRHFDGTGGVVSFSHRLLPTPHEINVGTITNPDSLSVTIPSGASASQNWPAGLYAVTLRVLGPNDANPRTSNAGALFLAAEPILPPASITRNSDQTVSVELGLRPHLRPDQDAVLALGSHTAGAATHPNPTDSVSFEFGVIPSGDQWVRLTVDGVESLLIDHTETPPVFDPAQVVAVPV